MEHEGRKTLITSRWTQNIGRGFATIMANRHLARTVAMQTLYELDFNAARGKKITDDDLSKLALKNIADFAPGLEETGFVKELINGVLANEKEIDSLIKKYAPEWPIEQITAVDRNVLRLGAYELKYAPNIPAKVAINEAIELAKTFGGESSGRFVNGVLGAIYRDMLEKGEIKEADKQSQKE